MTKSIPSDEEVLRLLARKRELLAELTDVNRRLLAVVRMGTTSQDRRQTLGRPSDEHNEWAAEAIAGGMAREEVYLGWLQRKDLPNDARARDAFRKAMVRRKG